MNVYRGKIMFGSNGEEDRIIVIVPYDRASKMTPNEWPCLSWGELNPLSEVIMDDMYEHGRYLSVRYFTYDDTGKELPIESIQEEFIKSLYGEGDVKYGMQYSEETGYLWTDDDINVGGHDLREELESHVGKLIHLEIDYSREPRAQ